MLVVSNTNPLIILFHCNKLDILHQLFREVYIPAAVFTEAVDNAKNVLQSKAIQACSYIKVKPLTGPYITTSHKLDKGEIEALSLAHYLNANVIILDDKRAQKEAKLFGIPFVSTFTILVKAHSKSIIKNLMEVIKELERHNIYLDDEIKNLDILG